jgi:hypothetical protein
MDSLLQKKVRAAAVAVWLTIWSAKFKQIQ